MEFGLLSLIQLLGSLGLFLYGMKKMSEGLQKVSGDKMRSILSAMTSNRFFGVLTGVLITALIQSSSATTLMTVSFVNAGLLNLAQSVSVIMGANVGTTVTAWMISLLGFKVSISAFAIPLFALSIPLIFSKRTKLNSWGEFIIGFSLLFLGLQFLKESMPDLKHHPEALEFLSKYTDMGFVSVLIFLCIGTLLTIIVQSSSATVAITLIMCSKEWISFDLAAAMVLGENIGTTITANLAAINASIVAKRAAFSHFIFNVFGVLWALLLFYPLTDFIKTLVNNEPSMGLAIFHSIFNVCNVLLMIWFVKGYVYICERVIRGKENKVKEDDDETHLKFLSSRMLSTSELSLLQVYKASSLYARRTLQMLEMDKTLLLTKDQAEFESVFNRMEKFENICDRIEVDIVNYLNSLSEGDISSERKEEVRVLMRVATEIESLGDISFNIARTLKKQNLKEQKFSSPLIERLMEMHEIVQRSLEYMLEVLESEDFNIELAHVAYNIENEIDRKRDSLKAKNMKDLEAHVYEYQESVYYLDIIDEYEHFGDYTLNIVQALVEKKI